MKSPIQTIRMHKLGAFFTLILPLLASASVPLTLGKQTPQSLSGMLGKVMPAVVNLSMRGDIPLAALQAYPHTPHAHIPGEALPPFNTPPKFHQVGSGVIVDAQHGYLLTNAHVIQHAKTITVSLSDGRSLKGEVLGSDPASDIAVVKIKPIHLTAIPFAASQSVHVGDFVAAIGNPFGLHQTVTSGVVSATDRHLGIENYESFIQTDAPINPGNSGGALIDMHGHLIGINTAILAPMGGNIGIGFAIPSNMAHAIMLQLIKYGKVERGVLGVMVQDFTPALAQAFHLKTAHGALVTQVLPGSPAATAGLHPEDVITRIDQDTVTNASQIRTLVGIRRVGSQIKLAFWRAGQLQHTQVTIAKPNEQAAKPDTKAQQSMLLTGLDIATYDQLDPQGRHVRGVRVVDVSDSSAAWFGGIRPGDVILTVNSHPVTNIETLLAAAKHSTGQSLLLKIRRHHGVMYLVVS